MAKKTKKTKKLNIRVSSLLPFEVIVPRPSTLKPTQEVQIVFDDEDSDDWTEEVWRVYVTNRGATIELHGHLYQPIVWKTLEQTRSRGASRNT